MDRLPFAPRSRRQVLRSCAGVVLGAAAAGAPGLLAARSAAGARKLRLAVVPQLTAVEMHSNWSPVVEALGAAGIACELVIHPSIARFEPEFLRGQADLVFLNPYHMVMAHRAHGYVPLVHDAKPLEGVLVVRQASPVTRIEQLQGQRLSFPAPNALAASLYIRAMLETEFKLKFETHYAMNHRNAVRQVLVEDSAAAGVVKTTLEMEPPEVQQALRVLYATPKLAPHPLAAHPRVTSTQRRRIVEVLQTMAQDPARKPLLKAVQMPDPVAADYPRDYAPLTRLGLDRFVQHE